MSLTLYTHPLASFCMKVHVALYEREIPCTQVIVDLADAASRAAFLQVWPLGKFPVLRDDAAQRSVPESSIIIEYLEQVHPGEPRLLPLDPELALQARLQDRFFDLHVHEHMQKIVLDKLRPEGAHDPHGVQQARNALQLAYSMLDRELARKTWAIGETFSMADCAAAPALFYANLVQPIGAELANTKRYWQRLLERPSFARVVAEAQPYFQSFPG